MEKRKRRKEGRASSTRNVKSCKIEGWKVSGSDNLPAWIVLRVGKWGSDTGWYFDVKAPKGARLCCRKDVTFRGLMMCNPYKYTAPTSLSKPHTPGSHQLGGCSGAETPSPHLGVPSTPWLALCLQLSAGPALCCAEPAWWLTRLLQSVTVDSFPIKNWLLNSKLNCCSDLAVRSHRGSPDTAWCVRICLFTLKGINTSLSEGWKPGHSYTESLCLFSWKDPSFSPTGWGE